VRYSSTENSLLNNLEFLALSHEEQLLYFHLRGSPDQTALGCFIFWSAMYAQKLRFSQKNIEKMAGKLHEAGFIVFDAETLLVYFPGYYNANKLGNKDACEAAMRRLEEYPRSEIFLLMARELASIRVKPTYQAEHDAVVRAMCVKAGQWLPGWGPVSGGLFGAGKPSEDTSEGPSEGGLEGRPEDRSEDTSRGRVGGGVSGRTVPVPVSVPAPVPAGGRARENDAARDNPPDSAARRWPLLQRFAGEVAKYTSRPLCDELAGAQCTAAEGNLQDLAELARSLGEDDVGEMMLRLRRPQTVGELKSASVPAIIVGKAAGWAVRDWRERQGAAQHGGTDRREERLLRRAGAAGDRADAGEPEGGGSAGGEPG